MRRPMSHICSLSLNSLTGFGVFFVYAINHLLIASGNRKLDVDAVEDRGVVRVERDDLLRVKRHAGLATLGERDRVPDAGAQVVVNDERLTRPPRLAREREAVLHLNEHEPPAGERRITFAERDPAN